MKIVGVWSSTLTITLIHIWHVHLLPQKRKLSTTKLFARDTWLLFGFKSGTAWNRSCQPRWHSNHTIVVINILVINLNWDDSHCIPLWRLVLYLTAGFVNASHKPEQSETVSPCIVICSTILSCTLQNQWASLADSETHLRSRGGELSWSKSKMSSLYTSQYEHVTSHCLSGSFDCIASITFNMCSAWLSISWLSVSGH